MANFDPKQYIKNNKYIPSVETVNAANLGNMANTQMADVTQRQLATEGYASLATPRGIRTQDGRVIIDARQNAEALNNERYKWNRNTRNNGGGGNSNSTYIAQLNALYDQIMNRGPFKYDLNGDLLYRQMADQYTQLGQQAMRDTMGQAAALTGGYGNSYANQVGNQAYQQYLTYLNEQIPNLYDRAYNVWQGEGDRLMQQYQLTAAHPGYLAAMRPSSGAGPANQNGTQSLTLNPLLVEALMQQRDTTAPSGITEANVVTEEDGNADTTVTTTVTTPTGEVHSPYVNPLNLSYLKNRLPRIP